MRIAFFSPGYGFTSEVWFARMLAGLAPDLALTISLSETKPELDRAVSHLALQGSARTLKCRIFRRLFVSGYRSEREAGCTLLQRALNREKIDCIMVNYLTTAVEYAPVWASLGKPVLVHCHGYDITPDLRTCLDTGSVLTHPLDYLDKVRALPSNVSYIANSEVSLRRMKRIGLDASRIDLSPLGVPIPASPPVRESSAEVTILYLGRMVDFKGPDLTILAFEGACRLGLKGRLIMAGAGPLMTTCELLVARSEFKDRIRLTGPVSAAEGAALRLKADIFTAHNRTGEVSGQEGALGVSILEAMADALPVVTGHSGGVSETVVDGQTGVLFSPGSIGAHSMALFALQNDRTRRIEMGMAGWDRAKNHFSERVHISRLKSIATQRVERLGSTRWSYHEE